MLGLHAFLLLACPAQASSTWDGLSFYMGDPHSHSAVSKDGWGEDHEDGCAGHIICGRITDVFSTARTAGLDWVAMSEHVNGPGYMADEDEYEQEIANAIDAHDPTGGFVTLPAAEVWFVDSDGSPLGHKNLLMFGEGADLAELDISDVSPHGDVRVKLSDCSDIGDWMDTLTAAFGDAVLIPHHSALKAPMPTDWGCHTDGYELGAEVYSHFGNSLEGHFDYDPPKSAFEKTGFIDVALDPEGEALKMGFWGGSDFHGSFPGRQCFESTEVKYGGGGFTVMVLDEGESFDRASLYEAVAARHTYATSGPLLPFRVTYGDTSGDLGGMGDDFSVRGGDDLELTVEIDPTYAEMITHVYLETPDEALDATNEGDGVWTVTIAAEDVPAFVYPVIQLDGEAWFGDDWCDDGGSDATETIWASPSWIEIADHDDDLDGVSWADGDCDESDPLTYPGAAESYYDGVDEDCLGGDDWDADGDGFALSEDCDDLDPERNPYAEDAWYDGVDTNCDEVDDFDQDGDGARLDDDCDDEDATRFPGAAETWYDGIDQDCAGDDDYDRDLDGHDVTTDCDDTRSWVYPGAFERYYDGRDANCDRKDDWDFDGDGKRVWPWGPDRFDRDASRWHW